MLFIWVGLGVLLGLALLVTLLVVVLGALGRRIPAEHTATSVLQVGAPIEQVYDAIADVQSHPTWARGTTSVFLLPDKGGMQQARVRMGRNSFVLTRTRHQPPTLLERTISDDHGPFSGTWLYRLTPAATTLPGRAGCEVKLTETGRVNSPCARAMMKHVFGYHLYTNRHLESLAGKFGSRAKARSG